MLLGGLQAPLQQASSLTSIRPRHAGEKGRRIRELTSVVQKRFKFQEGSVELYAEKVASRGLCAVAQAESLRYKLLGGLAVRRFVLTGLTCISTYLFHSPATAPCPSDLVRAAQ